MPAMVRAKAAVVSHMVVAATRFVHGLKDARLARHIAGDTGRGHGALSPREDGSGVRLRLSV
jgi:hypothetical protein